MFSRLFRSRWAALVWAGGVLWTAYDVADGAPQPAAPDRHARSNETDAIGAAVDPADLAVLANAGGT